MGTSPSRARRAAWTALGFALVGLGGLGLILPGLPATMFFVGAAACFSRSSPRFEAWLLSLPMVGRLVEDFRAGRGMPVRSKVIAVLMIAGFSAFAVVKITSTPVRIIVAVAAVVGITVVSFWVPTQRESTAGTAPPTR
ncbi:MAG: YbaN family protein [Microthrixaceae bacterium]